MNDYATPSGDSPQPTKTNGLAITSLVLGIVAIPCTCFYGTGILFGIAALITGLIARRQIKESDGTQSGDGLAIAGMILGVLAVLAMIAMGILLLMGPVVGNVFSNIVETI